MSDDKRSRTSGRAQRGSPKPAVLAQRACAELAELLQRPAEGIVSLQRSDDGWRIGIEVLEIRRVPDTADILAEYEVDTDADGALIGYRRARRYLRGAVEADR